MPRRSPVDRSNKCPKVAVHSGYDGDRAGGVIETDSSGRFVAVLSSLVADTEAVARAVTAAQVAEVRVLARAGQLAEREAAAQRGSVREHDMVLRSIAAELGGVLRVTDRTAQQRIGEARELVEVFPTTLDAWASGRITRGHVRVIVDAGGLVPAERRAEFEAEAIRLCEGDTPNRVRAAVEILAERTAERTFTERHRTATACRRVRVIPGADGMSDLVATVPTVIAQGILDRLTQQAMVIADSRHHEGDGVGDGDTRTMDQIRADVLCDMLLTGSPTLDPSAVGDRPGPWARSARRFRSSSPHSPCSTPTTDPPTSSDVPRSTPIPPALSPQTRPRSPGSSPTPSTGP